MWQSARVSIENGGSELVVDFVDRTVVAADIESGVIDGILESTGDSGTVVRLTAAPEELRESVRTKADLFLADSLVFHRAD